MEGVLFSISSKSQVFPDKGRKMKFPARNLLYLSEYFSYHMPHLLSVSPLIPIDVLFNIILNLKQIIKNSLLTCR